jgi:integrase
MAPPARMAGRDADHPADVLIAEVLALYARERGPKLADPVSANSRMKALLGWWGQKTIADIRRSTCEAFVAHRTSQSIAQARSKTARQKKVTEQGARRELEDLSAAIGYWIGEYPLMVRPKVWLPRKPESPRDALTRSQAARLLKAAMGWRWHPKQARWERLGASVRANRAHLRRFILIGLYTGTRPGVLPRLRWTASPLAPWVDLEAGVVHRRGRGEVEHKTKRRPMVKLPNRLKAHLARWREQDARWAARLADDRKGGAGEGATAPDTVLHHGARSIAGRIRRGFAAVVADAGLAGEVTPHWMRHTCATWLMEAGVSLWDAAAYTGMKPTTLESHYGHHRAEHQEQARRAL